MNKLAPVIVLVTLSAAMAACSPSTSGTTTSASAVTTPPPATSQPAPSQPSVIIDGQALFQTNCSMCHGADASGGLKLGDVTVPAIRTVLFKDTYKGDIKLAAGAVLDGTDQDGKPLNSAMPHFSGKLTEAQVEAIITYLQTLN